MRVFRDKALPYLYGHETAPFKLKFILKLIKLCYNPYVLMI
jgi:hypothetical protein